MAFQCNPGETSCAVPMWAESPLARAAEWACDNLFSTCDPPDPPSSGVYYAGGCVSSDAPNIEDVPDLGEDPVPPDGGNKDAAEDGDMGGKEIRIEDYLTLVSATPRGSGGNRDSLICAVSSEDEKGHPTVAYFTEAINILPDVRSSQYYAWRTEDGDTLLVSQNHYLTGPASGDIGHTEGVMGLPPIDITDDGCGVAGVATSDDMFEGVSGDHAQVFYGDICAGQPPELISSTGDGTPGMADSVHPSMDGAGGVFALQSHASLHTDGSGMGGMGESTFVKNRPTGEVTPVGYETFGPTSVSGDGRIVAYGAFDPGLSFYDIYIYNLASGEYLGSIEGDTRGVDGPSLNYDGGFMCFRAGAHVWVRDNFGTRPKLPLLVSISSTGEMADGASYSCTLNEDGGLAVFASEAGNLGAPEDAVEFQVYLRDRTMLTTTHLLPGHSPQIAPDGKNICFTGRGLLPDVDDGENQQIYLLDLEGYLEAMDAR